MVISLRHLQEVDVPGHAHAWGKGGFPNLVAHCPSVFWSIGLDPTIVSLLHRAVCLLHPTLIGWFVCCLARAQPFMWEVLEGFLEEMMELFPDPLFHLGGDEVGFPQFHFVTLLIHGAFAKVSLSCYDQDHALMERARQQG